MKQIANFLKNYRLKKNIHYDELIRKTTLTPHVIRLIEEGDFSSIGAPFYIKNFLSQYCLSIGLTESETEEIIKKIVDSLDKKSDSLEISRNRRDKGKWSIVLVFFIFIAVFLFLYLGNKKDFSLSKRNSGRVSSYSFTVKKDNGKKIEKKKQSSLERKTNERGLIHNEGLKNNSRENSGISLESDTQEKSEKLIDSRGSDDLISDSHKKKEKNFSSMVESERVVENLPDKVVGNLSGNNTIKVLFKATCMCWVNISFNDKVLKDFILKENENFSIKVPKGAKITIGNAKCLRLFFGEKEIKLPDTKVVKDLMVE